MKKQNVVPTDSEAQEKSNMEKKTINTISDVVRMVCNVASTATLVYLALNINDIIQFIFNLANNV